MIAIAEELLDRGHHFVLTSRFTQDCLENFFSVVRLKKPIPTPLEFKNTLKQICTAQYLKTPSNSSYEESDAEFLADFIDVPQAQIVPQNIPDILYTAPNCQLDSCDKDSLYNFAGYCIHSIKKNNIVCDSCTDFILESGHQYATLTLLSEYKENSLTQVSDYVFKLLCLVEKMFISNKTKILNSLNINISDSLITSATNLCQNMPFPDCCLIKNKIIKKFLTARLHLFCRSENVEIIKFKKGIMGSKSMAMRKLADDKY